jgi:hypothetical protein
MKIGDYLIVLAVALVALILVFALFRGDKVLTTLEFCLVLLVGCNPRRHAHCALGDHGRGRAPAGEEGSDCHPPVGD